MTAFEMVRETFPALLGACSVVGFCASVVVVLVAETAVSVVGMVKQIMSRR